MSILEWVGVLFFFAALFMLVWLLLHFAGTPAYERVVLGGVFNLGDRI